MHVIKLLVVILKAMKVVSQLLFVTALVGCSSGKGALENAAVALSENSDAESATVSQRAEVEYPLPPPADYHVDLSLVSDQIDSRLWVNESLPLVRFTVWGFDELAADVSATKIAGAEYDLRPELNAYPLRFDAMDFKAIEFQSGSPEALKYYITLEVDVDRDGKACNGDYRQNFNVTRQVFFSTDRTMVERSIEIAEIQGEECPE